MISRVLTVVALCLVVPVSLFADFQYAETTKITGGSIVNMMKVAGAFSKQARQLNEPMKTMVLVKGNRMARIGPNEIEIIDLDKETITVIDSAKKQYSVMTFQQMKQQIEAAAKDAKKQRGQSDDDSAQLSFKVNVRNTGKKRQVSGLNTTEAILTMIMEAQDKNTSEKGSMAITSDMWLAPEMPGYAEVREFGTRMAVKLGTMSKGGFGAMLASMQPNSSQGLAEMTKEMSKLKGVPVLQVMRMGTSTDGKPLPPASEAPLPQAKEQPTPDVGEVAKDSVASSIAGKLGGLGGLGGFGRKKKKEAAEPAAQQPSSGKPDAQPESLVLIEANTEMSGFSSAAIDGSQFEVPAGYKQVKAK
ncbi:MAG TPA: hypothetical protein VN622_16075 [Clostridia bacterium]|nr:hypothetical protein [Clostridia bacterium]